MRAEALLLAVVLAGCTKAESTVRAPVIDGSYLVFDVTESLPSGSVKYDVKLSFAQRGDGFDVAFETLGPAEKAAPIQVDALLVPSDNVISAYNIGRLWLPPEGRASGKRTPCGAVTGPREFKIWKVFEVNGLCGTALGLRFYEVNTGMLVGFQFSGAADLLAYVRESG